MVVLETQPHIRRVWDGLSCRADWSPLLLLGGFGTGRWSYLRDLIGMSEGGCFESSVDVLECDGGEGVDELRDRVGDFCAHRPSEFRHRYLVLKNLYAYRGAVCDTLLKVLEDRVGGCLRVLGTSMYTSFPSALGSRFRVFRTCPLSVEALRGLYVGDRWSSYVKLLGGGVWRWSSVHHARVVGQYGWDGKLDRLFGGGVSDVSDVLGELLGEWSGDEVPELELLDFWICYMLSYCESKRGGWDVSYGGQWVRLWSYWSSCVEGGFDAGALEDVLRCVLLLRRSFVGGVGD